MFVYDETRLIALFFKIPVALFSLIIAFRIRKKNPTYILNKLFMVAFICWGLYILGDGINFVIAPQNTSLYVLANALYDIQYFSLFVFVFLIATVARIIRFGSNILKKKKTWFIMVALLLVGCLVVFDLLTAITIIGSDGVLISPTDLPPQQDFIILEGLTWRAMLATIMPIALYVYAMVLFLPVIHKTPDRRARKKLIFMFIGNLLFMIGIIYFITLRIVFNDYHIWTMVVGQIIYITAPILINISLQ